MRAPASQTHGSLSVGPIYAHGWSSLCWSKRSCHINNSCGMIRIDWAKALGPLMVLILEKSFGALCKECLILGP
jgi:hypothetical protein